MNIKRLMAVSVFALVSSSAAQATESVLSQDYVNVPPYSWSGFYLGGKMGGFSSKIAADMLSKAVSSPVSAGLFPGISGIFGNLFSKLAVDALSKTAGSPVSKDKLPELSSIIGGIYVGSNIDFGNKFVFGIDMDMVWSGKKSKKTHAFYIQKENLSNSEKKLKEIGYTFDDSPLQIGDEVINSLTLQKKWVGATRARVGLAFDRFMPYVSGGISYAQLQEIVWVSLKKKDINQEDSVNVSDEAKLMFGFTLGAGIDYAMTDHIIMRVEYRYSDLGKKKIARDRMELSYKTNDLRVGVAYKF